MGFTYSIFLQIERFAVGLSLCVLRDPASSGNAAGTVGVARLLLGQVRTAAVLTEAASSAVAKLSEAISEGRRVETTLAERRELIDALERGGSKPRSAELRRLEIELRAAVYAETYFKDE